MIEVLREVSCGGITMDSIIPGTVGTFVNIFKIAIPIILIIFGMLDLGKAVMSNDEKEMKGAQGKFIKRIIYAVIVFLVVAVVQLIFGMLAKASDGDVNKDNITSCISCFVGNDKNCKP